MSTGPASTVARLAQSLGHEILELLGEHGLPGLAIAICDASEVLWSAAFGVKKAGDVDPVTTRTMFGVQSISKLYTATAVLLAAQDGLVELDVPVTRYLPEFSVRSAFEEYPERRMTLRHLLSHTAGLTHEAPVGNNFLVGQASFAAHCRSIADTWLRFPVGHHFEYSNLGFDLAAAIVQRVTRQPFHEFVRRRLLVPLGLERTTFDQDEIAREQDRAIGHSAQPKRVPLRVPMVGAGGLYTSVLDASRFVQFHLRHGMPLLQPRAVDDMYSIPFPHPGQAFGYGLGVIGFLLNGHLVRGHSGGGFGFLADFYWAPVPGIGVIVLTNSVNHRLQLTLVRRVLAALAGTSIEPPAALPEAVPGKQDTVPQILGEYVGRMGRQTITSEGKALVLGTGEERQRLLAVAPDEVVVEDPPHERFRILVDEHGIARYLLRVSDGTVWYRNDRPKSGWTDDRWRTFEGEYVIKAQGARIGSVRILSEGGCLRYAESSGTHSLWLEQYQPGIFYSSTGEVLDLTLDPPTYANIRLLRLP